MPRPRRISFPGALYHIICRGNNKEAIFGADEDKLRYLCYLGNTISKFDLELYGYVIMDNHIHMELKTIQANISAAMHSLNSNYMRYYNFRNNRTGHLFERRFIGKLVQKDRYALTLLRYIHYNPVKAGLAENIGDYRWSSYSSYLTGQDSIVTCSEILSQFGSENGIAINKFIEFMQTPIPEKEWEFFNKQRNGILGYFDLSQVPATYK